MNSVLKMLMDKQDRIFANALEQCKKHGKKVDELQNRKWRSVRLETRELTKAGYHLKVMQRIQAEQKIILKNL